MKKLIINDELIQEIVNQDVYGLYINLCLTEELLRNRDDWEDERKDILKQVNGCLGGIEKRYKWKRYWASDDFIERKYEGKV